MTKDVSPIVTREQYETPQKMPHIYDLFEAMIQFWVMAGLGEEQEMRQLFSLIPKEPPKMPGQLSFVVVPGMSQPADWGKLMQLIRLGKKFGENCLNGTPLENKIEVPQGSYLLIDVEDGRTHLERSQEEAAEQIQEQKRSALIAFESLAVAALFPTIENHGIVSLESRWQGNFYPVIYKLKGRGPVLYAVRNGPPPPRYGAPSCRERRVA